MADDASEFGFTIFTSWFTVIAMTCSVVAVLSFYISFYKSYRSKKGEVIVFTRYPVPGKSKTRLIPAIGKDAAAKLQVCMTEHIIRMLQKVYTSLNKSISVTLQYNGGTTAEMEYWLEKKLWGLPCTYRVQTGATLGEKLKNAIKESFVRGNKSVIVIGADIPGISEEVIKMSFESLTKKSDMVIGKAEDGGYYLIGFNINSLRYIDEIFDNIDWGTDRVFLQQIKNANNVGAMVHELPIVLQDVDTEEDIHVFEREVGVTVEELQDKTWSIIIPTLNEENNILNTLNNIQNCCSNTKHIKEVIISDGGSTDKTKYVVEQFSKNSKINVLVIDSKPGRGRQLLTGADRSTSHNYMFVHADTILPENYDILAMKCLSKQGVVAGAFKFHLDVLDNPQLLKTEPWWFILQMKALVWGTNARATKYEKPYGDQTLFMTKKTYKTVGGFPPCYLMEDYIMIEKLWTIGHIDIVDGPPVLTSYRRWRKYGYLKVTGLSQVIILAYKLGIHPNKLAQWYYGDKLKIE